MTESYAATYVNGVFQPTVPVDLPDHTRVTVIVQSPSIESETRPAPGTREAFPVYLEHLRNSSISSGTGWRGRDELYENDF